MGSVYAAIFLVRECVRMFAFSSVLMISHTENPQCQKGPDDWEMNTNRKIVLCFSEPELRSQWLDVRFPLVQFKLFVQHAAFFTIFTIFPGAPLLI
jgi:hypothetical protein